MASKWSQCDQMCEKYHFHGLFPQYLWYALMDFLQTFVASASWDIDELVNFEVKRSKVKVTA